MPIDAPQSLRDIATGTGSASPLDAAKADVLRRDADTRQRVATSMIRLFGVCNVVVLLIIGAMIWQDNVLLQAKLVAAGDRAVNASVIMALIAGTTAQLGALALIIGKYLFPGKPGE